MIYAAFQSFHSNLSKDFENQNRVDRELKRFSENQTKVKMQTRYGHQGPRQVFHRMGARFFMNGEYVGITCRLPFPKFFYFISTFHNSSLEEDLLSGKVPGTPIQISADVQAPVAPDVRTTLLLTDHKSLTKLVSYGIQNLTRKSYY